MEIRKYILPVVLSAGAIGAAALSTQCNNNDAMQQPHGAVFAAAPIPDIPQEVVFAGDTIKFDRLDMVERLDRELSSVVYSQNITLLCFKRANRYFPVIAPVLKEQGVSPDLMYLAVTESMMDPTVKSKASAVGLWQFLADTGREYGLEVNEDVDERCDPVKATVAACKYLKSARARYGNWASACASYNGGRGRIDGELAKQGQKNALDLHLVSETSRYFFRIIAYKLVMEDPKRYGYTLTARQLYQPVECDVVEVKTPVANWIDWAKRHGITYAQLREANPWIRSNKLPNPTGKTYKVNIPKEDELYMSKRTAVAYNAAWIAK